MLHCTFLYFSLLFPITLKIKILISKHINSSSKTYFLSVISGQNYQSWQMYSANRLESSCTDFHVAGKLSNQANMARIFIDSAWGQYSPLQPVSSAVLCYVGQIATSKRTSLYLCNCWLCRRHPLVMPGCFVLFYVSWRG